MRTLCSVWMVCALAACEDPAGADSGVDGDVTGAFARPAAPSPPVFAPCPGGWAQVDSGDGFDVCEPPAGDACPAGTERFVDAVDCAPVGAPCPAGEWAEPPAGASAVYVRAGASGGDGTQGSPYGVVQDAIDAAPAGAAVLLGKGTYAEAVGLRPGTQLIGACAAETILAPSAGPAAVGAVAAGGRLENVTLRPTGEPMGVAVTGELTLRGVVIEGAADEGVFVFQGGSLDAEELVVRDVRAVRPRFGRGLAVGGAQATVRRAIFERCPGAGILSSVGSTVVAEAVVVRDSGQQLLGSPQVVGQGTGQSLTLRDSVLESATGTGLLANEDGDVSLDMVVIRQMRAGPAGGGSGGVLLRDRGHLEARRLRIEAVDRIGAAVTRDSDATFEDSVVFDVSWAPVDGQPVAIGVLSSAPALTLRRVAIARSDRVGVQVEGGAVTLEDVTIRDTGAYLETSFSPAAYGHDGGSATLTRVRIEDAAGAGVLAHRVDLTLRDVHIREVAGANGVFGRGVDLVEGAGDFSRLLVERTREVGVYVRGGARLALADARVGETLGRDCQETTCADTPGGHGLVVVGASAAVERFELGDARLCGALIASGGELDLRAGAIRDSAVGACIQVDGYELSRVTDDVRYEDNAVQVEATYHDVPAPLDPLPSFEP